MALLGYHAREGAFGGVPAHTHSSMSIQYFKLNGKPVGEIEYDSYIAGEYSFSTILLASDDVCIAESLKTLPTIQTVITKCGEDSHIVNAAIVSAEQPELMLYTRSAL